MNVTFGALADPLSKQLGLPTRSPLVQHLQRCADSITLLAVKGLLSEAEVHRARRRLLKKIATAAQSGER